MGEPVQISTAIFASTLAVILKPADRSDRSCLANVANWVFARDRDRAQPLGRIVLALAREATADGVRNPRAAFVAALKRELGYQPPSTAGKSPAANHGWR